VVGAPLGGVSAVIAGGAAGSFIAMTGLMSPGELAALSRGSPLEHARANVAPTMIIAT
jgi:hypothetical protein